jgi:hypothetical protein
MDKVKITDEILLKNNFQLGKIVKGHQHFYFGSGAKKMDIFKSKEGNYLYSLIGNDFPVVFISEINEYYKKRTGKDLLY